MTQLAVGPVAAAVTDTLLASLDPEQRAAATLPDGPALIIAPAGSGKTTTLIARLGVLLARGVPPERIAVATFNRDAALELSARIGARLAPTIPAAGRIEVRTLHALARQVVLDGGQAGRLVSDRLPLLRTVLRRSATTAAPDDPPLPDAAALDTEISAWKVERRAPQHRELVDAYRAMLASTGAVDFDDLVVGAADALESDPRLRLRWQGRFTHLCVDEFQDVDAAQLRLVRLLAEPQRNLFVVGDDDQTIYAWRLADVRRILSFEALYPGTHRVQLATNYRCPAPVVAISRRLIGTNRERFVKRIDPSPAAGGDPDTILAYPTTDDGWPDGLVGLAAAETDARRTVCFLARTRSELGPMLLALARAGVPHTTAVPAAAQADSVQRLVTAARGLPGHLAPFEALLGLRAGHGWRRADANDSLSDDDHAALDALLGWAVGIARLDRFLEAYDRAVARLEALRRPDAAIELVTVHGAKGREWQTVVVLGMEEDRFPNRRALVDAADPARAIEEERRLAYVALTRATRRLILAYDPARPSRFLGEMGIGPTGRPGARPP
ncbi:MAG TPA: ATP-dependent helicase [Candidatus Limnocylindria bacterium]|nr:ATP-dependent helicase [Candidatus Limnocylindria bacterium]